MTATVYIIHKIDREWKVLLHKHPHHQIWIGVGGHMEGDENPPEAAVREAREETGLDIEIIHLKEYKLRKTKEVSEVAVPFTILQEYIRSYKGKKAHYHIDCIYFGRLLKEQKVVMKEQWGWFSQQELKKVPLRYEVKHIVEFAFQIPK